MKTTIITGHYKGRVLKLPVSEAARPTRSRVRQAAFNLLQGYTHFTGASVVELCCGSGAWGLEALSRGAAHLTLLDTTIATAKANVQALGVGAQVKVVQADAAKWQPPAPADLILADPPYNAPALLQSILAKAPYLGKPGSLWCLETAANTTPVWPTGFKLLLHRTYGVSAVHLAQWQPPQ